MMLSLRRQKPKQLQIMLGLVFAQKKIQKVHWVAFKRICCFHCFPPVGEILPAVGHDVPGHAVLGGERTRARTESGGVRDIYYISNVDILYIWVVLPRTGKMSNICHNFFF